MFDPEELEFPVGHSTPEIDDLSGQTECPVRPDDVAPSGLTAVGRTGIPDALCRLDPT